VLAAKGNMSWSSASSCSGSFQMLDRTPAYTSTSSTSLMTQPPKVKVLLRYMPQELCTDLMIEAMLDQADLEDAVLRSVVTKDRCSREELCEVLLTFGTRHEAKKCVAHFHGRKWAAAGIPVAASIATPGTKDASATQKRVLEAVAECSRECPGENLEPPPGLANISCAPATSVLAPPGLQESKKEGRKESRDSQCAEDSTDTGTSDAADDDHEEEELHIQVQSL